MTACTTAGSVVVPKAFASGFRGDGVRLGDLIYLLYISQVAERVAGGVIYVHVQLAGEIEVILHLRGRGCAGVGMDIHAHPAQRKQRQHAEHRGDEGLNRRLRPFAHLALTLPARRRRLCPSGAGQTSARPAAPASPRPSSGWPAPFFFSLSVRNLSGSKAAPCRPRFPPAPGTAHASGRR